jgi:hypothetical protein
VAAIGDNLGGYGMRGRRRVLLGCSADARATKPPSLLHD